MAELLDQYWHIFLSAMAGLVWLVRLEARVNKNWDYLARLEEKMVDERIESRAHRAEQNATLREIQRDIKLLLSRGHQVHWGDKTQPPR